MIARRQLIHPEAVLLHLRRRTGTRNERHRAERGRVRGTVLHAESGVVRLSGRLPAEHDRSDVGRRREAGELDGKHLVRIQRAGRVVRRDRPGVAHEVGVGRTRAVQREGGPDTGATSLGHADVGARQTLRTPLCGCEVALVT